MSNLIPIQDEFNVYLTMAKKAFESQLAPPINGKPMGEAAILNIMLMARELGIPPMQAIMGGMYIVKGKVELSARMMNLMIRKAGHTVEIQKCDAESCIIKGVRKDTKEYFTSTFTIADAKAAGLLIPGGPWDKWREDMMFAKCITRLARRLFADVIGTSYIKGEIEVDVTPDKPEIEVRKEMEIKKAEPESKKEQVGTPPAVYTTIKIEPITPVSDMTVCEFVETLKAGADNADKYSFLDMERYLLELHDTKGVRLATIMEQALSSESMTERFCKAWQKWYDDNHSSE